MVGSRGGALTAQQRAATDPAVSAWVGASAGSGKTQVLISRILRLLLTGVAPHRILCLTYTRAAAAEMANRVGQALSAWAAGDTTPVTGLLGRTPTAEEAALARRLFAQVVDAPEGLWIETIHGFCQSLLARFPLEAGVGPHFRVIEERTADELMNEARNRAVADAARDPSGAAALATVSSHVDDVGFGELMGEILKERRKLARALEDGGIDALARRIHRRFGFDGPIDDADIVRAACREDAFDRAALRRAAEALAKGSESDVDRGQAVSNWLASDELARAKSFEDYSAVFLTDKGGIRKTLATKAALKVDATVGASLLREAERVLDASKRRRAAIVAGSTAALAALGARVLEAYDASKRRLAVLDYDDLIETAARLLQRPDIAPWVLYKLDGIEHVLVDEAQDTSPEQWTILRALTGEFFVGKGAADASRSIFAVGDPKQSIFGFQGADPTGFAAWREAFGAAVRNGGGTFVNVGLHLSYRSTGPVIEAVDRVFARDEAKAGVDPDNEEIRHHLRRVGMAGLVEVWPIVEPEAARKPEAWEPPVRIAGTEPSDIALAHRIAERVRGWIGREDLPARGRKIRAGDIMVLVRRRTRFVDALVRRLKQLKVPVAGMDRMTLADQIAVKDVLSLLRFLLQPDDDLSLAEALRSPLFGMDEVTLEAVAAARAGATLWSTLGARRPEDETTRRLRALLSRVDFAPPHEFLSELLIGEGGRLRLAQRLGEQAGDPIDELLALALDFERDHAPSLQRFVAWIETGAAEVKRNLEQGRDEVRIMTVHGAKGLQAPVVILPDTCAIPKPKERVLWLGDEPIWTVNADYEEDVVADAKTAESGRTMAEYRRLLYVAMTRAEDRLYVGGWSNGRKRSAGNWYDLIAAAISAPIVSAQDGPSVEEADRGAAVEADRPEWLDREPPAEPAPPRPLAPSRFGDAPPALSPLESAETRRYRRGQLVHRLLETLPELPAEARVQAGRAFFDRVAKDLDPATRRAVLDETLAVIDDPRAKALFAPGSRAEVGVSGLLGSFVVSGLIDRLAVDGREILIVDYKTNRAPPSTADAAPRAYVAQLAAYRACLAKIYPEHEIRCFLLWTVGPSLMELPKASLDEAMPHG
jgi:ATP-dependent helicase/nuclease subunit A